MTFTWVLLLVPPPIALTCVGLLHLVPRCLWPLQASHFRNKTTLIHLCCKPPCLSTCERLSISALKLLFHLFNTQWKAFLSFHVTDCVSQRICFLSDVTKQGKWWNTLFAISRRQIWCSAAGGNVHYFHWNNEKKCLGKLFLAFLAFKGV